MNQATLNTAEKFLMAVREHQIVSERALKDFLTKTLLEGETGESIARKLIQQDLLSEFQARMIYNERASALVLNNYVIVEPLGAGGMGEVFKARHRVMNRLVALKVLSRKLIGDPQVLDRFHREVQAVSRLSHPNIVTAHDAGEAHDVHYYVMELVQGRDLAALVKAMGPLSVERAVDYLKQCASGLQYAHQQGIVHRDIKPHNLLLDTQERIKILDLGLARIDQLEEEEIDHLTTTGTVMGTVDFMSPEQALSTRNAGTRSDTYSLGCTFYYLLTGRSIYPGGNAVAKILAHRDEPIPRLPKEAPEELQQIFQKMVAKQPDDRQQSMGELLSELQTVSLEKTSGDSQPTFRSFLESPPASQLMSEFLSGPTVVSQAMTESTFSLKTSSKTAVPDEPTVIQTPQVSSAKLTGTAMQSETENRSGQRLSARVKVGLAGSLVGLALIAGILLRTPGTQSEVAVNSQQPAESAAVLNEEQDLPPLIVKPLRRPKPEMTEVIEPDMPPETPSVMPEQKGRKPPARLLISETNAVEAPSKPLSDLEKWLAERTVLTVAQDGSGTFTTIQEALAAQKDGEVVQILDRGPYRETLEWRDKTDCGLVSTANTIVEVADWSLIQPNHPEKRGHLFSGLKKCRLSGLTLLAKPRQDQDMIPVSIVNSELNLEQIFVPQLGPAESQVYRFIQIHTDERLHDDPGQAPLTIRECLFELPISLVRLQKGQNLRIEQSLFLNLISPVSLMNHVKNRTSAVIQENVFHSTRQLEAFHFAGNEPQLWEIQFNRNTIFLTRPESRVLTISGRPAGSVQISGNLLHVSRPCAAFAQESEAFLPVALEKWSIQGNSGTGQSLSNKNFLTLCPPEELQQIQFLSQKFDEQNYLRIDPASITSGQSNHGQNPTETGALPWGPPSAQGDWLTRLLKRRQELQRELKKQDQPKLPEKEETITAEREPEKAAPSPSESTLIQ